MPDDAGRSSSIDFWFCEVGGTIFASRIVPACRSRSGASRSRAAPRCSRGPCPRGHGVDERRLGRLVLRDDPQRLVRGVDGLDGAHDDAAERVAHDVAEPDLGRDLARQRRQLGRGERVARERADEVVADARERRVERVRALDVRLGEVLLVLRDVDVEPVLVTMRPRSIAYSPGCRSATKA